MDDLDDGGKARLQTLPEEPQLWPDQEFIKLSGKTPPESIELPGTRPIKTVSTGK